MIYVANPLLTLRPFEEALDEVRPHFDAWEILIERHHGWKNRHEMKDILSTVDMEIQIHGPFNDVNTASMNDRLRQAGIEEIKKSFKIANLLDVDQVNIHPGYYSPISKFWKKATKTAIESLITLKNYAEEYGVHLTVENLPERSAAMGHQPEEMLEFLNKSGLNFCFDVGHANTSGRLEDFLDGFNPTNMHLHDNDGVSDKHWQLGEGNIDFERIFRKLNYNGPMVIEGRDIEELVASKKYLEKLLKKF